MAKSGFRLKRGRAVSLDQWFSKSLLMVGLWQRRLTTEDAEHAESCCFLGVLCVFGGFPDPFRKVLKDPLNQTGGGTAKSSEKFEQAFMEAFGRTENGSAKPPGRLQQMFQQILLWRSRIG